MARVVATDTKKSWVPEISDDRLNELAQRIKPMVRMDGDLYYIKDVESLRGIAFIWSPKLTEKAAGLEPLCDITTYHTFGYHGFFKPSIAEVLAQIPDEYNDQVVAFEIVEKPETADDLNKEREAMNAGYHVAKTCLYRSV